MDSLKTTAARAALVGMLVGCLSGCGGANPVAPVEPSALETSTVELQKRELAADVGIRGPEVGNIADEGGNQVAPKVKKPKKPRKPKNQQGEL